MDDRNFYGVCETIGTWDYFYGPGGTLYRARAHQRVETRSVELVAPNSHAEFALRVARLAAGLPERGV